jgi:hypothetical protein
MLNHGVLCRPELGVFISFVREYKVESSMLRWDKVEVEASIWLHGGGNWLSVLNVGWVNVAFFNFEIEENVGSERDWLSTNWSPGVGLTVGEVIWAAEGNLVTRVELLNGEIPASEDFGVSDIECLWKTSWFSS